MDMPLGEDQLTRELTNLRESLTDFRNEMRSALTGFVRTDVYAAQQETMRAQQTADYTRLQGELLELRGSVKRLEDDKRQNRGLVWGALGSAAVALFVAFFKSG